MPYVIEIDRFRILLHILRCFMHLSAPFMVMQSEIWPIKSFTKQSEVYDYYVFLIHVGVMEAFFILNGFFAIQMLRRKTVTQFILNRIRRIFIPFLIGMITIIPVILIISLSYRNNISLNDFSVNLLIDHYETNPFNFGHLWSLWYLLIVYSVFLILESKNHLLSTQIRKLSFLHIVLLTILVSSFALFCFHRKYTLLPVDCLFDWQMIIYYLSFFCLGVWIYEKQDEILKMKANYKLYLLALLSITINVIYQKSSYQDLFFHFFGKLAYVTHTFCSIVILFSLIKYLKIGKENGIKVLSQNMYWLYWIEVPIAIAIHYFFIDSLNPSTVVLGGGIFTVLFSIITFRLFLKNSRFGKLLGFSE